MTVSTTTNNANFIGNSAATMFPFTFRFFVDGDLVVTRVENATGVEEVLDLGVDYSVQGAGNAQGGSVTLLGGPLMTGFTLNVARILSPVQLVSIINQGKFLPEVHEQVFDYLTMLAQQNSSNSERSLLYPLTDPSGVSRVLPNATARALRVFAFDASGSPIVSNMTLDTLEAQAPIAQAAAQAALASAVAAAASEAGAEGSADLAMKWAINPVDVPVMPGQFSALHWATKALQGSIWSSKAIGEPFAIWSHLAGVPVPPVDSPGYRYIKLTAADPYNAGVLSAESVTGVSPLVQATGVITDPASPMNGQTIRLINTERRTLKAGNSGAVEADAMQGFSIQGKHYNTGTSYSGSTYSDPTSVAPGMGGGGTLVTIGAMISDGVNGTPRKAVETRVKNIGADYYMRIR